MTKFIVTYVTDNGDHYHEIVDNFDEFIAMTKEDGMQDYYQQVHVFKIVSTGSFFIEETEDWSPS